MSEDIIKEKKIKDGVDIISKEKIEIILEQMKSYVCKINHKDTFGTGFFCMVPFGDIKMPVLITNYHIINNEILEKNNHINISYNDEKFAFVLDLCKKRKKYLCPEYDTTIIELKEEDKIKHYLELDDNIFKENENFIWFIKQKNKFNIIHICSTDSGASGSPILNLKNNKVIGLYKGTPDEPKNFNYGTLLKYPLNDFINKTKNVIKGEIYVGKDNINEDIQIINSFENFKRVKKWKDNKYDYKYENEKEIKENIEIKINGG